ncbi:MAG: SpoIID/LytB domain-containing protein [Lachnospiraceae bacterium]|nr:SpoIID/LytB domain-containing protein [Lachnospiraceae bacterium]
MLNRNTHHSLFSFQTKICIAVFLLLLLKAAAVWQEDRSNEQQIQLLQEEQNSKSSQEEQTSDARAAQTAAAHEKASAHSENSILIQHHYETEPTLWVLITDSGQNQRHEALRLTGRDEITVKSAAGTRQIAAGEKLDLTEYFSKNKITVCSVEAKSRGLCLLSVKKGGKTPVYPGILHIWRDGTKGSFYVVNEVLAESYLPGVVSSEMPVTFGLEALKAQAVCARSYAASALEKQKKQKKLSTGDTVGWNLVDTTDDQVYMSGSVDADAITACKETRGQILRQENALLKPHYYSTSWGKQADGAVFQNSGSDYQKASVLPALSSTQIRKMNQAFAADYQALEQEEMQKTVRSEQETQKTVCGEQKTQKTVRSEQKSGNSLEMVYDRKSPWFRWSCELSFSDISSKEIEDLIVVRRGKGGYASALQISYADGSIERVNGASAIRKRLGRKNLCYRLWDGSTRKGLTILPSAFFYLDVKALDSSKTGEKSNTIRIFGGGFGHGFGMSQYGAANMAEKQYKYTEILSYYYKSARISEYY